MSEPLVTDDGAAWRRGRPVLICKWALLWLVVLWCGPDLRAAAPAPHAALGINLAGPVDWNTELPFVDVFHLARAWISQKPGAAWGQGPALELDARGWVRRLAPDCFAETPQCTINGGHYPSGVWTVLWEGEGRIELSKGTVVSNTPNCLIVNVDSRGGGFFLRLRATKPENPVHNIRVLLPGFTAAKAAANPWNPGFLARWRGMACLRLMDFQETNNTRQRHWADRVHPDDATYAGRGLPIELLCDLANRLETDAWFCMPHEADDDYIREFAKLARTRLGPQRKIYLEYSNEVWNSQFKQNQYAAEQGRKLGLAEKPWEAAWHYTSQRSVEIFALWEEAFGGRERLVRVLPSQAANSWLSGQIAGWKDAATHADALAIAPYISMIVPAGGQGLTGAEVATWSVERLLDHVETNALPECVRWMRENQKVASQHGLKLICYEAGQHLVGTGGAENNEALTRLFLAANAHPRMAGIYRKYYAAWEAAGGDLLCHFSSVGEWSKWGSWGLLQYADDPPESAPKFTATLDWARQLGQRVGAH